MQELTEGQYRAIKSIAHVVEEKLREIEETLSFSCLPQEAGIQLEIVQDLSENEKQYLKEKITAMKELLKEFALHYELEKEKISLKRMISVKSAFLWEDLTGATAERLSGYGEIDENGKRLYESYISCLTRLTEDMMNINPLNNNT